MPRAVHEKNLALAFGFSRKAAFLFFSLGYAGKLMFIPDLEFFEFGLNDEQARFLRILSFYGGAHGLLGFLLYEFSFPRRKAFCWGSFCFPLSATF